MTTEASSDVVELLARPMRASDEAFVYSNVLRWYRESDHAAGIPNDVFFQVFKAQIAAVLLHFTVIVAHPKGNEDEIAGVLAHKGTTVGFLYVKKDPWRQMGVATFLANAAGLKKTEPVWALYGSSRSLALARSKGWNVRLVPATQAIRLLLGVG
jgi:hypothetical protein